MATLNRRRWTRALVAGLLVAGVTITPTVGGAQDDPGPSPSPAPTPGACTPPYPPIAVGEGPYASLPQMTGPEAEVLRFEWTQTLDGAGSVIRSASQGPTVVATTPAGDLRLEDGGRQIFGVSAGDLDGDGTGEIWVLAADFSRSFVVPSGTVAGTHEVSDVGVRVPPGMPVGVEGRWMDGLVVLQETDPWLNEGTTIVLPPAALLAPGPGGDASAVAPIVSYPGVARAVVGFAEPQLVYTWFDEPLVPDAPTPPLLLRSVTAAGASIDFTTAPHEFHLNPGWLLGQIWAVDGPAGRFLQFSQQTRGPISYVWSYDDPCADGGGGVDSVPDAEPQAIEFTG